MADDNRIRAYTPGEAATFLLHNLPIAALAGALAYNAFHPFMLVWGFASAYKKNSHEKESYQQKMKFVEFVCPPLTYSEMNAGSPLLSNVEKLAYTFQIKKPVGVVVPLPQDIVTFKELIDNETDDLTKFYLSLAGNECNRFAHTRSAAAYFLGKEPRVIVSPIIVAEGNTLKNKNLLAHEISHLRRGHMMRGVPMAVLGSAIRDTILTDLPLQVALSLWGGFTQESMLLAGKIALIEGGLYVASKITQNVTSASLHRNEEYNADRAGAQVTQKPLSAVALLEDLGAEFLKDEKTFKEMLSLTRKTSLKEMRALFAYMNARMLASHPPVGNRIHRLRLIHEKNLKKEAKLG